MQNTTGARLAAALLGYVALVIILLTLNPFYLARPERLQISLHVVPRDILQNIILFLPFGFLYRMTGGSTRTTLILGATLSAGVEALQLLMPLRFPSPVDLVTNTFGTWLGAWLYTRLAGSIAMTPAMVGRLALETPLTGLLYLLIPLLWMNALAREVTPGRWVLSVLLGLCGAFVLSDLARGWWGAAHPRLGARVALAAGAWFLLGAGPAILRPWPTIPLACGVALVAAARAIRPWRPTDRRFEQATLSRVLPILALYLLLAALWPPFRALGPWHGSLGLANRLAPIGAFHPAPLLEYLVAFTVLGYVYAEWHGRAERSLEHDLARLMVVALASAFILEGLVGFQVGRGASLVRAVLVVVGALFGGVIYHRQRDYVRSLLGRSATRTPERARETGLSADPARR